MRGGPWKLALGAAAGRPLYDLRSDIGETKDVAPQQPMVADALLRAHAAWSR